MNEAGYSKVGPSRHQEEEGTDLINTAVTTYPCPWVSFKLCKKKISAITLAKYLATRLLPCWDNGANRNGVKGQASQAAGIPCLGRGHGQSDWKRDPRPSPLEVSPVRGKGKVQGRC